MAIQPLQRIRELGYNSHIEFIQDYANLLTETQKEIIEKIKEKEKTLKGKS